jgi:outer membrane lipoprotein carrier protein
MQKVTAKISARRRPRNGRPHYVFIRNIACIVLAMFFIGHAVCGAQAGEVDTEKFLADLEKQRTNVETYAARFTQQKTLALFDETKTSSGTLFYRAPGEMIWKYEKPEKTQMLIDGETVSFYFPELEQIEIYHMESGGASSFFSAFEANAAELKKEFDISVFEDGSDVYRVDLKPKSESGSSQVSLITLWLDNSGYLPQKMLIRDASGDSSMIELSDIRINEPVAEQDMRLDAPEGTPVIEGESGLF